MHCFRPDYVGNRDDMSIKLLESECISYHRCLCKDSNKTRLEAEASEGTEMSHKDGHLI